MTLAFEEAARLAGERMLADRLASLRGREAPALFDETRAPLLTPREAKGMEFDHVVAVEPAAIVDEAQSGQGLREVRRAHPSDPDARRRPGARPLPGGTAQRWRPDR